MSRRWRATSTSLLPEWAAVLQFGNILLGAAALVALVLGIAMTAQGDDAGTLLAVLGGVSLVLFWLVFPLVLVALVAIRNIARDTHRPVWSAFMGVFGLGPALLWLLIEVITAF